MRGGHEARAHREAFLRANTLASISGARLLLISPARAVLPAHTLFPHSALDDQLLWLSERERLSRVSDRWARFRARHGLAPIELIPCEHTWSGLLEVIAQTRAELVVTPACCTTVWPKITTDAPVPVLLAHRPRHQGRVVAASNLELPERPVLRAAALLAEQLRAELTIVHNQPLLSASLAAAGLAGATPFLPQIDDLSARERALQREARELGGVSDVRLTRRLDAAAGILEAAFANDADLIVVGAPRGGSRFFADGVTSRLCALSDRSVLVVPTV